MAAAEAERGLEVQSVPVGDPSWGPGRVWKPRLPDSVGFRGGGRSESGPASVRGDLGTGRGFGGAARGRRRSARVGRPPFCRAGGRRPAAGPAHGHPRAAHQPLPAAPHVPRGPGAPARRRARGQADQPDCTVAQGTRVCRRPPETPAEENARVGVRDCGSKPAEEESGGFGVRAGGRGRPQWPAQPVGAPGSVGGKARASRGVSGGRGPAARCWGPSVCGDPAVLSERQGVTDECHACSRREGRPGGEDGEGGSPP